MTTIAEFLAADHKRCDGLFVEFESAVSRSEWAEVSTCWPCLESSMLTHFEIEEDILFPEIEAATGMTQGPTEVMRMDHRQMRALLQLMGDAVAREDAPRLLGLSETMMVTIQQHNMKEEQVLYPMADELLKSTDEIIASLRARTADKM